MVASRKRHQQQELFRHGGKRKGAAVRSDALARASPQEAPKLKRNEPAHIVLRAVSEIGTLRRRAGAVRKALLATVGRESCRIVHVSIEGSHIHLLVEADHRMALARHASLSDLRREAHQRSTQRQGREAAQGHGLRRQIIHRVAPAVAYGGRYPEQF